MKTKEKEMSLESVVERLGALKSQIKSLQEEEKLYVNRLKTAMKESNKMSIEGDAYIASLTKRESASLEEEKLINYIEDKYGKSMVSKMTKKTIDEDKLESLIFNGKLNAAEIKPFQIVKETSVLTIKKK